MANSIHVFVARNTELPRLGALFSNLIDDALAISRHRVDHSP